jgi:hypothetical protein
MTARFTPYVQELLENEYARDNLREGADKLRAAYGRSRKRRVKAARDEKLRHQLGSAVSSIGVGAKALANGRRKPAKRRGRLPLALLAGIAIGAAVALGASKDLRSAVLGSGPAGESGSDGSQK